MSERTDALVARLKAERALAEVASEQARQEQADADRRRRQQRERELKAANDHYIIGCDPGQSVDPTAIAAVRVRDGVVWVGHLERLPLGTTYPQVINRVIALMGRKPFADNSELVLDMTGVGRPVADMFAEACLRPVNVTITAGDTATVEKGVHHVPKLHLVSGVQALLHADRLKVQAKLPDAPILKSELQDFQAHVTDQGRWKFGARIGRHDDLVLAVALACWRAAARGRPWVPNEDRLNWLRGLDRARLARL